MLGRVFVLALALLAAQANATTLHAAAAELAPTAPVASAVAAAPDCKSDPYACTLSDFIRALEKAPEIAVWEQLGFGRRPDCTGLTVNCMLSNMPLVCDRRCGENPWYQQGAPTTPFGWRSPGAFTAVSADRCVRRPYECSRAQFVTELTARNAQHGAPADACVLRSETDCKYTNSVFVCATAERAQCWSNPWYWDPGNWPAAVERMPKANTALQKNTTVDGVLVAGVCIDGGRREDGRMVWNGNCANKLASTVCMVSAGDPTCRYHPRTWSATALSAPNGGDLEVPFAPSNATPAPAVVATPAAAATPAPGGDVARCDDAFAEYGGCGAARPAATPIAAVDHEASAAPSAQTTPARATPAAAQGSASPRPSGSAAASPAAAGSASPAPACANVGAAPGTTAAPCTPIPSTAPAAEMPSFDPVGGFLGGLKSFIGGALKTLAIVFMLVMGAWHLLMAARHVGSNAADYDRALGNLKALVMIGGAMIVLGLSLEQGWFEAVLDRSQGELVEDLPQRSPEPTP